MTELERLQKELAYYKRQVEELTGAHLKLEYRVPALTHELGQKRQGFALLSQLQQSIGAHQQISSIFDITIAGVNSTLGMDRTVVLTPTERANHYRVSLWTGYREEFAKHFQTVTVELPPDFVSGEGILLVNRGSEKTAVIEQLQKELDLPYFVAVPVKGEDTLIGVIVSGRLKEARPLYPPFDQGDVDTFKAISGLISATVQNMRVAILEETDRLKTEFFANISHEFRTPITLTVGPLEQLLSGRYGQVSEEAREQLELMVRNQERLLGLVNQILDLAKLEAGQMTMRAAPIGDVNALVRDRAEQFRSTAEGRHLELRLSLEPKVASADLYLDRDKFDKLLFNLLSNAFKFTTKGFVEIATTLGDGKFQLTVTDSGIGIKEDQLLYIFDRFRQADSGAAREYGGTGLGLALVKEVAKLHGGEVVAHSQLGRGSIFQVTLPLGRAHLDPSTVVDFEEEDLSSRGKRVIAIADDRGDRSDVDEVNTRTEKTLDPSKPTVLYAEDNPDLRKYVYTLLLTSYNVFLAADGGEGLQRARRHRPDLILTDFMMPHVSGREFLQSIRADPDLAHTPVIFLTARAGTGARIESLEGGADDYLTKPFDQGELLARVRNLLQARRQERELERLNHRLEAKIHEQMAELVRTGELKRFLPEPIVRNLLAGALPPDKPFERRKITSLSIGIGNFASLTETMEAEDLAQVVNDFIRQITAVAIEHGGTVDKIVADTVHVLFGAPEEMGVERQAKAATETAMQARSRLQTLSLQAGINTGFCTVGIFGSELLSNYTAIGEPVNVAARLRGAAPSGAILVGAQTHALLQSGIEAAGPKTLTGSLHPISYYEIAPAAQTNVVNILTTERVAPGMTLGHFKIISRLGGGGMGEVFLTEDQKLHRLVALKIAPPEIATDETRKERFFLEARSASGLHHGNIAHIYDIGEHNGISYIAMEYVDGATLRSKISGTPMQNDEVLSIALQIGSALEEAHRKGVVHRDIKPENVMITPSGDLKVLDFGLAKMILPAELNERTEKKLTHPGMVMGTVHYMSPEQALGRDIDFRTDIFSLGVVMYEMSTGRLPFSAATTTETIDLIVHAEPVAISRFNYTVPKEVEYVIRKCMQKSPASRYQSTTELVVDLKNLQKAATT